MNFKSKKFKKDNYFVLYDLRDNVVCYFENFEDAVKARKEAEEKYFGEYSYDNSVKQYQELQEIS